MTINDLNKICIDAINKGKGDAEVSFDSEAVCFDCHLIDIESAFLTLEDEGSIDDRLILGYSWNKYQGYFHMNRKEEK